MTLKIILLSETFLTPIPRSSGNVVHLRYVYTWIGKRMAYNFNCLFKNNMSP